MLFRTWKWKKNFIEWIQKINLVGTGVLELMWKVKKTRAEKFVQAQGSKSLGIYQWRKWSMTVPGKNIVKMRIGEKESSLKFTFASWNEKCKNLVTN